MFIGHNELFLYGYIVEWLNYINKPNRINKWNFVHCWVSTSSKIKAVPLIFLLKYTHNLNYKWTFMSTLLVKIQNWKQFKCISFRGIIGGYSAFKMEHYSAHWTTEIFIALC